MIFPFCGNWSTVIRHSPHYAKKAVPNKPSPNIPNKPVVSRSGFGLCHFGAKQDVETLHYFLKYVN